MDRVTALVGFLLLLFVTPVFAQPSAVVEGRVIDAHGVGVAGVKITLRDAVTARRIVAVTDDTGRFSVQVSAVPAAYDVTFEIGEREVAEPRRVSVGPAHVAPIDVQLALGLTEQVTVTDSREERLKSETPVSVGVLSRTRIADVKPTHPSQLLGTVPGVWVNTTGGEGHMTAIRQPLTTSPVYLYLEDGVPMRSTGFFNHNALYEANLPAAERIEVTKGPGSVLYGSDAIGGIVNVTTRPALGPAALEASLEGGPFGWRRVLAGGNASRGADGVRVDVNLTHTDGWRDATGYDRRGASVRWDRALGSATFLKSLVSYGRIDQQTAGSSTLSRDDYIENPRLNLTPISFREVEALRASTDLRHVQGSTLINVIAYYRNNRMALLPNWSLTYDPTVYDTDNQSYGLLARVRRDLPVWRTEIAAGLDAEVSPGGRTERLLSVQTSTLPEGQRVFTGYGEQALVYDYDVTFRQVAPYAAVAASPIDRVRLETGVRYDHAAYRYRDQLTTPPLPRYQRPPSTTRDYDRVTPKIGATVRVSDNVSLFASHRAAFRVPSEGQLFRQGTALDTVDLRPVRATNREVGARFRLRGGLSAEVSWYDLVKRDDILSFRDPVDGTTEATNAGRTRHRGVEIGAEWRHGHWLDASVAYSHARHRYVTWRVDPAEGLDYSGGEMESAPRGLWHAAVTVRPRARMTLGVDVSRVGSYWMDAANTHRYEGHTLLNMRGEIALATRVRLYASLLNATDARYAETASYTLSRGEELAPGLPRSAHVGLSVAWPH
ncbi:MAG: TonB-dependent receptor [Luteitalea sp.]|nr:TonB-dependent receptor [Luteitalea sp.]